MGPEGFPNQGKEEMKKLRLNDQMYELRITRGGGEVWDLMPYPQAVAYVEEDRPGNASRFGVLYHLAEPTCSVCGDEAESGRYRVHVEWLGGSLEEAFGEGARVLGFED